MKLQVRLASLPDLDSAEAIRERGYKAYGRFAVLEDGSFWSGDHRSVHPEATDCGWCWAVDADGALVVSSIGVASDSDRLFGDLKKAFALLIEELVRSRAISKPDSIERI